MQDKRVDLAIVGAGFSGPILAAKIAEKGVKPGSGEPLAIALIDAGPYYKGAARPGYGSALRRQMFTNLEGQHQQTHLWNNDISLAKIVGGSSLHWAGQAFLPTPVDYLHWQQETGVDWTEDNLVPAVSEIRREFNVHPMPEDINTPGNRLFFDVASKLGYTPERTVVARRNCVYCGFCVPPMMCKYDSRASTLWTYIPRAERAGVEILADTFVEKILIETTGGGGIARGLVCRTEGSTYRISADKILVCGGYVNTPLLLMRSGYGPGQWRGNPIVVENPNIGRHIDGHPFGPAVSALFDEPLGDGKLGSIVGYHIMDDIRSDGEGRLLIHGNFGVSGLPSRDARHPVAPPYGREHKRFMREQGILRTGSLRLRVTKASGRWAMDPDGKLLYGGDHTLTLRRFREGTEKAQEILDRMGARRITVPPALKITPQTRGEHRVGSCRAGLDPETSVVNPYFESHDVENLLICDGSVIPRVPSGPSGTPQASITVFAADRIIERHFSR
ncbi:MAG: GMC family oxidoreductase [Acidobacteria bacterium]|nr:GMC family oxidoreductase [Acidobacteriota bacterium]